MQSVTAAEPRTKFGSAPPDVSDSRAWRRRFAVRGVYWRQYLDWAVINVPFYLLPILLFFWTLFFYFFAAPARKAIIRHLNVIFPGSSRLANYVRAFCTLQNFAWTITEAAIYKILKPSFRYILEGEEFLQQLAQTRGAIVLTAHMGNYDLGAGVFTEKFQRPIQMVRAPEPDHETAQHLDMSLQRTGEGAVKVNYNVGENLLSVDLLAAIRNGETISIQGDRVNENVSAVPANLFEKKVLLPSGPFVLAAVAQAPIFPLFVVRAGYRCYKIVVRPPIVCESSDDSREQAIGSAVEQWARVLEEMIARHWDQWYAFTPVFK